MRVAERLIELVTERSRLVIVVFLVLTLLIGSGVVGIEQSSSLDQFQTDSKEADKQEYIDENFGGDEDNTTAAQLIVRDDNALSKESLIATLELQEEFRANETINETLADEPFDDLANVIATAAIREDRADELDNRSADLDERSEEIETRGEELESRQAQLEEDRAAVESRGEFMAETLNETRELRVAYDSDEISGAEYEAGLDELDDESGDRLPDKEYAAFVGLIDEVADAQAELNALEAEREAGEISEREYEERSEEPMAEIEGAYDAIDEEVLAEASADPEDRAGDLETEREQLEADADAVEADGEELEDDAESIFEIDPNTDERIEQLESMNQSEIDEVIETVLDEDASNEVFAFLPTDYEPGSTTADARAVFVTQTAEDDAVIEGEAPQPLVDSQLAMNGIVEERFGADAFVFGTGIITDEIDRSLADSLGIVLPLALGFVVVVLTIAYRDPLDIVLGGAGIFAVLLWTFGFMGWAGIAFNQIMVAVPVLLIGLSIDYAIHVFMRHREQRETQRVSDSERGATTREQRSEGIDGTRSAMAVVLSGLGVALVWVTATAVIGFLSNLVSPVGPIRDFGIASAFGIAAALLVFGVVIPAVKVELDAVLEARGYDRRRRAFGTGEGPTSGFLSLGGRIAQRTPFVVIFVALLLTAGGAYGAAGIDTTFEQEDFIADDPPDWMQSLPEPLAVGEYSAKDDLAYVDENFLREDTQTEVLVEGEIGEDDTLERLADAEERAAASDATAVLSGGEADVRSPLSAMESVAGEDDEFNETFTNSDTTGDGVPDSDIEGVYNALFEADAGAAADVIHRTGTGEYESFRLVVSIEGAASTDAVTEETREVASVLDGDGLEATATGQPIVFGIVEDELLGTVIESMVVTLVAVFAFLMLAYRWVNDSAILGAVTLLPIVFSVAWILGSMALLDVPFNVMTGTITSLTIGLGVAYNIHMTERFVLERERGRDTVAALERSVTGTGGALLGSAATTVGGFGVLVFAILPPLQQFGLITGLTIVYAFLGSVFVLPSLLVVWARYLGPDSGQRIETETPTPAGGSD